MSSRTHAKSLSSNTIAASTDSANASSLVDAIATLTLDPVAVASYNPTNLPAEDLSVAIASLRLDKATALSTDRPTSDGDLSSVIDLVHSIDALTMTNIVPPAFSTTESSTAATRPHAIHDHAATAKTSSGASARSCASKHSSSSARAERRYCPMKRPSSQKKVDTQPISKYWLSALWCPLENEWHILPCDWLPAQKCLLSGQHGHDLTTDHYLCHLFYLLHGIDRRLKMYEESVTRSLRLEIFLPHLLFIRECMKSSYLLRESYRSSMERVDPAITRKLVSPCDLTVLAQLDETISSISDQKKK